MKDSPALPVIALCADGIEIPGSIVDLPRFRSWARSDDFPESGRVDWIAGRMEVDMSPEDLTTHGTPKSAIAGRLVNHIQEAERGLVFIDRARLSSPAAERSCEPDVLVILVETLESGRARFVPRARAGDRFIEIEGSADLVVECISDSSEVKDRDRLRDAYHRAGVREYWIADARGPRVELELLRWREGGYEAASRLSSGFSRSEVLECEVRLVRRSGPGMVVFYRLEVREVESS
jgi:Uma2 family endonuclease